MRAVRANAGRWDVIRRMHVADSEVEQALLASLPPGPLGDVVDLGTGTGRMLELVAGRASRLVGIDRSREMLALARTKLERANARGWQVRHGDVHALPLADESFDVALMHQVLHFLKDPEEALAEAARILRRGGLLIVVDFARHEVEGLRDEHAHIWLGFADQEVATWLRRAGLTCRSIDHLAGDPLTVTLWSAERGPEQMFDSRPSSGRLREASGQPRCSGRTAGGPIGGARVQLRVLPAEDGGDGRRACGRRSSAWRRWRRVSSL